MQTRKARRGVQFGVQQHAIDHEPHEQRLNHFQTGHEQCQDKDRADRISMRPKPPQILAQIFTPFSATFAPSVLFRRRLVCLGLPIEMLFVFDAVRGLVEPAELVILYKPAITLTRGVRSLETFRPVAHDCLLRRGKLAPTLLPAAGARSGPFVYTEMRAKKLPRRAERREAP